MTFVVLPKQEYVRPFGYELYFCKKRECDTAIIDPARELDNHRIRCEVLAGDSLLVETVEHDGDEWLITFFHKRTDRRVFGRTRRQIIPEIAAVADLAAARRQWEGMVVFSRRGVISTLGTNSTSSLTGLRVDIREPLIVVDIRWGTTPLPVKPLWLMVKTGAGKSGLIPLRYSWTNTMPEQISRNAPWGEDILLDDPVDYNWDDATWELINNHRVILGMTPEQARISWGEPLSTGSAGNGPQAQTVLTYLSHDLFFSEGRLVAIKERLQENK